ncbi:hypothetical protein BH20ACT3_BH20ACT3_09350 [soil metagenome]
MSGVDDDAKLDRRAAAHVLRRVAPMLHPYRRQVWAAVGFAVTSTLAVLAGPYLLRYGIDRGIVPGDTGALNTAVAAYVVVAAMAYVATRNQVLFISRAGEGFLRDLRKRVFGHLLRLAMPF